MTARRSGWDMPEQPEPIRQGKPLPPLPGIPSCDANNIYQRTAESWTGRRRGK